MADPIDLIGQMLELRGWTRRHLLPAFGGHSGRMSDALNRRRPLSLSQIRCLVINYGMNASDMIKWYPTKMQPAEPMNVFEEIENTKKATNSKAKLKSVA
jgi:hypothetical protein